MKEWFGSAAICINENKEVLMVKGSNSESWAIPSGGIEQGETPEECCIREVKEETGYDIVIEDSLFIKETEIKGYKVKSYYFKVKKTGESEGINDPDNIIVDADWKSLRDIRNIQHAYPEDLEVLEKFLK
ncbi:NUDIX hydrolase [Viridibacillus sp. FSL R5-0477]|uniref:MutT/NUDIX family protein n=1 Tax=Viridibacillus arenosi FSL R5-213 TaxID=1227360 RepID=W4EJ77_9BACL|nr:MULTISPECIES: NUDIX hydrolase [Viridibacillus]ETT80590.1 MutT/NUDIX family protein [Viridibacillus arenosi FSL R5-213]OMC77718.1 NUDIX domain-containing protein [Viridibacillus sp. FSL H8-0123]OMC82272.1 NUDIX domain-containing protein [Viridibacillus sp. FSL H7-0596]OMC87090.1 NUDIX domain-containing protein [Viridibacillus arenosi]